jgi:hypothetical protein
MDLVDRYVYAVKRHLPAKQQDDIANELTEDILSQIKDKEEEVGRALDESEQEAVLKQYGHPYLLAMRYRPQQYLIGPALFPFYFPALKIAMALAFAVQVIVAFSIGLAQNAPGRILPHIVAFPGVALHVVFWVTLSFAVADYWQGKLRLFDKWSPRSLPRITSPTRHPGSSSLIVEIVANIIFLAWWVAVPTYPFLMLGPAAAFLHFSPAWSRLYPAMFVPAIVSTVTALGILMVPTWTWLARLRPLAVNLSGLFVVSVALNAGPLVVAAHDKPELVRLVKGINDVTTLVLVVISLITMAQVLVGISRLVRHPSR